MYTTSLEKVLAESLARCTGADIPGIIEAAQAACMGGNVAVATGCTTETVTVGSLANNAPAGVAATKAVVEEVAKTKRITKAMQEEAAQKLVEPVKPVEATTPEPEKPVTQAPTVGIDLSGLFTGSGADKKVVKTVFLTAVEQANTLAHLVALNATCDCGFATGDFTEETAAVLKRKLARWGAAQE